MEAGGKYGLKAMGWSLFSEVGRGLDRHHQFRRGWQVPFFRFLLGS